jgi:predicted nucleic acid-binding protein
MTVDTNILIDGLRGKSEAKSFLLSSEQVFSISVVSVTELYAGVKGSNELLILEEFLTSFTIHGVDEAIAKIAGEYLNRYAKSHDVGIADALIAATATQFNEQLATLNTKDFPMLPDVMRPY